MTATIDGTSGLTGPATKVVVGTTTNDSAAAGYVGEFIESNVSTVAIANSVTTRVTTISLTAGDWDVWATHSLNPAGTTVVSVWAAVIGPTDASLSNYAGANFNFPPINFTGSAPAVSIGKCRVSVSATTSIYLNAYVAYNTSTLTNNGYLAARRVR